MDPKQIAEYQPRVLNRQQKFGVVILAISAVAIFVLWFVQLKTNLYYTPLGGVNPATLQQQKIASDASSQISLTKDTDKDGLTDYQETELYHTSIYLADTDSDGISDADEVARGTDPLCAQGRVCTPGGLYSGGSVTSSVSTANPYNLSEVQAKSLKQAFGEKPDPIILRQALMAASNTADQQHIAALTDEQLLLLYQKMLDSVSATMTGTSTSTNP